QYYIPLAAMNLISFRKQVTRLNNLFTLRERKTMRLKMNTAKLLVTGFLIMAGSPALSENRLATDLKRADHCQPLPTEECAPSLDRHYKRGCITEEEYRYGLKVSPQ